MQQFGRYRMNSGHRVDTVDRSKMTRSGLWEIGQGATFATPICWSRVRLSSMCQLSLIRPFSTFTRSVAMNSIGFPLPCVWPNLPVKWPVNFIMDGNVIAGDDHLFYPYRQIRHRGAEMARCERRPLWPLWASRRQGVVCKGRRDRSLE